MARSACTACVAMLLAVAAAPGMAGADGGSEWSLLAGASASGSETGDVRADSLAVRWIGGGAVQVWADVPVVSVDRGSGAATGCGVVGTPGGPTFAGQTCGGDGSGGAGTGEGGDQGGRALADGATLQDGVDPTRETGLGDIRVGLARRLAGRGAQRLRLDAGVEAKLPTADESRGLGTGEWDGRVFLAAEYETWYVTWFGDLGWNQLGDPDDIELNDGYEARAGLEFQLTRSGVVLWTWADTAAPIVAGTASRSSAGLGVRSSGKRRFSAVVSAGLSPTAPGWTAVFGWCLGRSGAPRRPASVMR